MEVNSESVFLSPEDDAVTDISSSPPGATTSINRSLKGDLVDTEHLLEFKQVSIDVDNVSEEMSQVSIDVDDVSKEITQSFNSMCEPIGWRCKSDRFPQVEWNSRVAAHDTAIEFLSNESMHFDRTLWIEIVSDLDTLGRFDLVRPWHMTVDTGKNYSDSVTCRVCSSLLEAKSPFFSKLFSNGMRESVQMNITLRINPSEKDAFMELMRFIHSDTLRDTSAPALLDVLLIADKFEVTECMSHCCQMLLKMPMTYEFSLLYLGLPAGLLVAEVVQPLLIAAKQYLCVSFRDISRSADELMRLPKVGIEAVFASDDLQVASEDVCYDLLLNWFRIHYPEIEERKDIMACKVFSFIRFPFLSFRKLNEVLQCPDLDPVMTSKMVVEALFFKAQAFFCQQDTNHHIVHRNYKYQAVKIIYYALPMKRCEVFMDVKRKNCEALFISGGRIDSEIIHLGGQGFFLSVHCSPDRQDNEPCFGLFLGKVQKGSPSSSMKYEFSVMIGSLEEYACDHKGYCILGRGKAVGYRNFFGLPGKDVISDDFFFINDVLHIKCVLTVY